VEDRRRKQSATRAAPTASAPRQLPGARFIREAVEREIKRRSGEPAQRLRDQFA
jgi:hypothetical protein